MKTAYVAGVDEAGRGPLAGPVFAAAVVLNPKRPIMGLNDSKKLSEKKREHLYQVITEQALDYGIALASEQEIDEVNILQATFLAMRRAITSLKRVPTLALVDGNQDPHFACPTQTIVRGDSFIDCISAASILAKVSRDRYMMELDVRYPGYGFARNKGYPTPAHKSAIRCLGLSEVHRKTFRF